MKLLLLPTLLIAALAMSSCGLARSATQLPVRTLQSVGRAVGMGLEQTEVSGDEQPAPQTEWKSAREEK
ncbi:MAG: hypothetical protein ABF379_12865 [Akkermansiaceae bacterium]